MKPLIAALLLASTSVSAQEVPEPKDMFVRGGMLCKTQVELETLLTGIHINNGKLPETIPDGCGRFQPPAPMPLRVTPLAWYETPSVNTLIAEFKFVPNGWTNYGWIAYIPNPDYTPKKGT